MPLARFDLPFEHPDWIFEPKLDGFQALAYVEGGACRLVSRNRNAFKTF
jgi:bifunctional non-homologous end joining protein LigD